jgi:hypothetical protein
MQRRVLISAVGLSASYAAWFGYEFNLRDSTGFAILFPVALMLVHFAICLPFLFAAAQQYLRWAAGLAPASGRPGTRPPKISALSIAWTTLMGWQVFLALVVGAFRFKGWDLQPAGFLLLVFPLIGASVAILAFRLLVFRKTGE